jgi:hypothetical protein
MTDTSIDDGQLYIDGKFTAASSGRRFDVTDPSTGAVVGTVADADPADIDTAVAASRLAFDEGPWPKMSGRERAGGFPGLIGGHGQPLGDLQKVADDLADGRDRCYLAAGMCGMIVHGSPPVRRSRARSGASTSWAGPLCVATVTVQRPARPCQALPGVA